MQTPWGPLDSLDLNNHELAINILGADKHQLVEGLVVESLFDQIMRDVSPGAVGNYTSLDVETTIVRAPRGPDRWISFVWARTRQAGLRDYLRSLEKSFSTYLLRLEKGYFYATPVREGAINGKDTLPLEELVRRLGTATPKYPVVSDSVRDPQRQRQAFWGFLSERYGKRLCDEVLMPRILINYGIQPYFRAVWNLDRAFIYNGQIWLGEIKHKFPFGRELCFGMNVGELEVIERLTAADIQCLHVILVKPLWSKKEGSMYLLNNLQMRSRAALAACVLNQESTSRIFPVDAAVSGSLTSFSGTGLLKYRKARVTHFSLIGNMGEPTYTLAEALAKLMRGCALPAVTEECLRSYRAG